MDEHNTLQPSYLARAAHAPIQILKPFIPVMPIHALEKVGCVLKRDKEVCKGGRVPRLEEAVREVEIGLAKLQTRVETGEGEQRRGEKLLQMLLRRLTSTAAATTNQGEDGGYMGQLSDVKAMLVQATAVEKQSWMKCDPNSRRYFSH